MNKLTESIKNQHVYMYKLEEFLDHSATSSAAMKILVFKLSINVYMTKINESMIKETVYLPHEGRVRCVQ